MEKNRPHHPLGQVKQLVAAKMVKTTGTARTGAAALDLDVQDILNVVQALTPKDFDKSMTSYADHKEWQDVYKPSTAFGDLYIKFTISGGALVLILSFKEL